jgi:hypothetical protein
MYAKGSNRFHELSSEPTADINAFSKVDIEPNDKPGAVSKLKISQIVEKEKKRNYYSKKTIEIGLSPQLSSVHIEEELLKFEDAWIKGNVAFYKTNKVS